MSLRKRGDTGDWKMKHLISLFGELALEEAMSLSSDRLRDDDDDTDAFPTSQHALHAHKQTSHLMIFREIIGGHYEDRAKHKLMHRF
jgi:hypothetical protein